MAKKSNTMWWIMALGGLVLHWRARLFDYAGDKAAIRGVRQFQGWEPLRVGKRDEYEQAVRSAQEIDCQLLTNGRDENMVCIGGPPTACAR